MYNVFIRAEFLWDRAAPEHHHLPTLIPVIKEGRIFDLDNWQSWG